MTGGQVSLSLDSQVDANGEHRAVIERLPEDRKRLRVIRADAEEEQAHSARLDAIDEACQERSVWHRIEP